MTLDIADRFPTPGGRYRIHGPFSGQEYREDVLADAVRAAIKKNYVLGVRIDSVRRSYQSSFLDEAFGGLIREHGFAPEELAAHLVILSDLDRFRASKTIALNSMYGGRL